MTNPRDELKAHLDGELPAEREHALARLLRRDPSVRREAAEISALGRAIAREKPIAVTGRDRVLAEIRRRTMPPPRIGVPAWVWAGGAAAAIGLAWFSWPVPSTPRFTMRPAVFRRAETAAPLPPAAARSVPERWLSGAVVAIGGAGIAYVVARRRSRRTGR